MTWSITVNTTKNGYERRTNCRQWSTVAIAVCLGLMASFPLPALSTDVIRVPGIEALSVSFSGPSKIKPGVTKSYTITYKVKRVRSSGVDPSTKDITIPISLLDDDDMFRDGDDLLSFTSVVIPRGPVGSTFQGSVVLQLKCTPKNELIHGVGYSDGKSGEATAEVYAEVNDGESATRSISCD